MSKKKPEKFNVYVHSNFQRREDDDYKTVDKRCTYGLLEHYQVYNYADVCAPSGSGIVDVLKEEGHEVYALSDAFTPVVEVDFVAFNPPYTRDLVDQIIWEQIYRIERKQVVGVAALLRSNFAFAKSRQLMFRYNPYYAAEIKLLFRPKWLSPEEEEARKAEGEKIHGPVHNFVWHIWHRDSVGFSPIQLYSEGKKPIKRSLLNAL